MTIGTAVLIFLLFFAIRFGVPFGLMWLINRYNQHMAVNPA